MLFVGVESTPIGAEVNFGFEGGGETFGGLDGAGRAIEMGKCGSGMDYS